MAGSVITYPPHINHTHNPPIAYSMHTHWELLKWLDEMVDRIVLRLKHINLIEYSWL